MTCSCPKCFAIVEVDLPRIPENGTFIPCQECKGRFWINRESYARMALKKEGKSYCDKCGSELAHSIVCTNCGVMYPDYYLVQSSRPPRRKIEKTDWLSVSFTLRSAKPTYTTYSTYSPVKEPRGRSPVTLFKKVGVAAIVAILAIGLGYFYHLKKVEQLYAKNYMRTLYTLKSGTELSLNTCAKISTEWRTRTESGQQYSPHVDADVESNLTRVKDTIDKFMLSLNKPPKKFTSSGEKLANLYGVYSKTYTLAIAPSSSLSAFTSSISKSQNDFKVAVQDLKSNLSQELTSELKIAQVKYKGLRDI